MATFWRVIGHIAIFIVVLVLGFVGCLTIFGKLIALPWLTAPLISFSDGSSLPAGTAASAILSLLAATAAIIWRLKPMTRRLPWIGLGIVAAILFAAFGAKLAFTTGNAPDARASQIADIGSSNGDDIVAKHISADGSTVVGLSQDSIHSRSLVFRWTRETGLQLLKFPDLDKDRPEADATGVSANGLVIVGRYTDAHAHHHVYRWTAASGVVDVGAPQGWRYLDNPAVSADGTAVAGSYSPGTTGNPHLYVWTKLHGFKDLGVGALAIVPIAVTNDGSVISGWFRNADDTYGIFQWTKADGFRNLGTTGKEGCDAVAASADGSAIVGYSWDHVNMIEGMPDARSFIGGDVFLWTRATGIRKLGTMGAAKAMPQGISADGAVILGSRTDNKHGWQAFMWSQAGGVREIGARNWHDSNATDISADGSKILGHYYDADLDPDDPADKREHSFVMPPIMVDSDQSEAGGGQDQSPAQPPQNGNISDLTLALVKDDPGNSAMAPVFDASGSGRTYIPIRELTKPGEIESVTAEVDETGRKVLRVHLADAAGSRLAADKSIPGQEVALELGSAVLASATVQTNFGADFEISGLTESDVTRILAAISSDLVATRIPKVATAPKWIIVDPEAKFLSKSVFVSASTGLIHLTYCSAEPCEPSDNNVDVFPATVDCKRETFNWTNFMEVPVTDTLLGKHAIARNSPTGILIEGLCSQKESLPVH